MLLPRSKYPAAVSLGHWWCIWIVSFWTCRSRRGEPSTVDTWHMVMKGKRDWNKILQLLEVYLLFLWLQSMVQNVIDKSHFIGWYDHAHSKTPSFNCIQYHGISRCVFFYFFIICLYVRIQFLSFLVFVQSHIPDSPELGPNARWGKSWLRARWRERGKASRTSDQAWRQKRSSRTSPQRWRS